MNFWVTNDKPSRPTVSGSTKDVLAKLALRFLEDVLASFLAKDGAAHAIFSLKILICMTTSYTFTLGLERVDVFHELSLSCPKSWPTFVVRTERRRKTVLASEEEVGKPLRVWHFRVLAGKKQEEKTIAVVDLSLEKGVARSVVSIYRVVAERVC